MRGRARVGDVLRQALRGAGLEMRLKRSEALGLWPKVVGHPACKKCRAVAVREGVLIVSTSDAVWANVLTLEKPRYLERLQEMLGKGIIRDIRFSSRGWREQPEAPLSGRKPRLAADLLLDSQEQQSVQQIALNISDADLRASATKGLAALIKVRKWRQAQGWKRCESCGRLHRGIGQHCPPGSQRGGAS